MPLNFTIEETSELKSLKSENYNYTFNKQQNTMLRWGTDIKDIPAYSPYGPEIAYIQNSNDIEGFHLTVEMLCATKTLAMVVVCGTVAEEEAYYMEHILNEYGVSLFISPHANIAEDEGAMFSLYVDEDYMCYPSLNATEVYEGIPLHDTENLVTGVWYSPQFAMYRWHKLQEKATWD